MNNINVVVDVPDHFLDDILTTAFEGGSNYWLDSVKVVSRGKTYDTVIKSAEVISIGGTLEIHDDERVSTSPITWASGYVVGVRNPILTKERLLNAIEWYIGINGLGVLDDHDAQDSDSILQYALFGEVVYG